ncbi:Fur family transcriptional regulator [Kitasatospora sp. NPDC088548]|uniref:Fur family transcriptional regulator n=1 Tax=Kitasatospora sp. NPDC088548 TaxID=3364075 RepID=UPI00381279F6
MGGAVAGEVGSTVGSGSVPPARTERAGTARACRSGPDVAEACRELLRSGGGRCTGPRLLVLAALREHGGHLTVAGIHRRIAESGACVSVSTVYRAVERLAELDLVHGVRGLGGELSYGLVGEPHHHALCAVCGAVSEFPYELLAGAVADTARRTGFRLESLVVNGVCPDCQ